MAPVTRGKSRGRGGSDSGSRGHFRGSSRGRGRGSARGAKGARGGATKKNPFYSTRVEEQPGENEDAHEDSERDEDQFIEASDVSSDSGDDDAAARGVKSYNLLLQSLSANIQRGESQRKRRKVEIPEAVLVPEAAADDVDEVEEAEEIEDLGEDHEEGDNEVDENEDPFTKHVSNQDEVGLARSIQDMSNWAVISIRSSKQKGWSTTSKTPIDSGAPPIDLAPSDIKGLHIKERLKAPGARSLQNLDAIAGSLAINMFNYRDIFFPQRTMNNAGTLRTLACLHSLNHLFKTRDKVIKDNARLARDDTVEELEFRDQGFTRPKVLIILPTRQSCVHYVEMIVALCEPEQQENKKRFQDFYANGVDNFSDDKPPDFRELFAGNDDDGFRLGMKFTRKTIKYFSQFYNSDIIFASPLGLRRPDDPKKQDHDFLSSIEIVIMDQADAILMQNWEHVEYVFEHLNLQPKETHGCDFSRVRHWYLDGQAKYLRQTILLSAINFPALNKMFTKSMLNIAGKVKYNREAEGAMIDIGTLAKQTFSRFDYRTPVTEPDDRFKYFSEAIVPSLIKQTKSRAGSGQGYLIYIPSYLDFVRVRNYMASSDETQDLSFGSISEYTEVAEVARARSHFLSGRHAVLLYTERAHHFRRYHLKGVKKIVMYALPENPVFYKEVAGGYLQFSIAAAKVDAREAGVRALFSKLDLLKLERIVGTSRCLSMLRDKGGDTFDFE